MNLQDALNWVEEHESNIEESKNDICLISKLPIRDGYCIELQCGHKFDYEYLHNHFTLTRCSKQKVQCPYCRSNYSGFIPFYELDCMKSFLNSNITSRFRNHMLTCKYEYKMGKNKNKICNCSAHKFKNGIYCLKHHNQVLRSIQKNSEKTNKMTCQGITKKGIQCKCAAKLGTNYCKRHSEINN